MYLNLPHGVMKVVKCRSFSTRRTLWYPFHASQVVFFLWVGTDLARWNGDGVWCVSHIAYLFRAWKSTVLRGVLSLLVATTMRWHHVRGVPAGTGSTTSRQISLCRSCLTVSKNAWQLEWGFGGPLVLHLGQSSTSLEGQTCVAMVDVDIY